MRHLRCAVMILLPFLAACETLPGVAASSVPASPPTDSPMLRAVLARAPADPIGALPERMRIPPVNGTWTAEFIQRLYAVTRAAEANLFMGSKLIYYDLQMPAQLALAGLDGELAQLERDFLSKADGRDEPLSQACRSMEAGCSLAFDYRHELAIIRLARGRRKAAEQLMSEIEGQNLHIRLFSSKQCDSNGLFLCAGQAANRMAWRFQAGQITEAIQAMDDWQRRAGSFADAAIEDVAQNHVALLVGQGRLREAAAVIDGIAARPNFRGIVVAPVLFAAWDGAIVRGAGTDVQIALAAIAHRIPPRYPNAHIIWRHAFADALECRAAHVAVTTGLDRAGAQAAFERQWQLYGGKEDDRFSTGFCLHSLAARVGRADLQPAIREAMRRIRSNRMREIQSRVPEIAGIMERNGMKNVAQSSRAMAAGGAAASADPQAYLLLDDAAFEQTLLAFLEATKSVEDPNLRKKHLAELMRMVMQRVWAATEI